MRNNDILQRLIIISTIWLSLIIAPSAQAVPSFARQTGVSCASCHTSFPQLTAFGRQFKMQGYTLTNAKRVKGEGLNIDLGAPLSMMLQTTWSKLKTAADANTSSSQTRLPSQLSIFYAGRITDKIGSFVQITAEDGGSFSQDNTDMRFADNGKLGGSPVTYGITLNNNPTVQDPWNSTPVWGFPWFEAGYGYDYPDTLLTSVGGAVAGLTGYAFWNNHLYAELGAYQAANSGPVKADNIIKDGAPYGRLAYTTHIGSLDWEIGALGMSATTQDSNKLTDAGVDTELQWTLSGNQSLTLDANYIHETQDNSQHINTMKADLTWYTNQTWGVTVGYHGARTSDNPVSWDEDTASWLPVGGSLDTDAYQVQLDYTPWLNTRFAAQYTAYTKRDGTTTDASNDNQFMLGAWLLF